MDSEEFRRELRALINKHGWDGLTDTPDFILARHLYRELSNYAITIRQTREWHGWPTLSESLNLRLNNTEEDPHVG